MKIRRFKRKNKGAYHGEVKNNGDTDSPWKDEFALKLLSLPMSALWSQLSMTLFGDAASPSRYPRTPWHCSGTRRRLTERLSSLVSAYSLFCTKCTHCMISLLNLVFVCLNVAVVSRCQCFLSFCLISFVFISEVWRPSGKSPSLFIFLFSFSYYFLPYLCILFGWTTSCHENRNCFPCWTPVLISSSSFSVNKRKKRRKIRRHKHCGGTLGQIGIAFSPVEVISAYLLVVIIVSNLNYQGALNLGSLRGSE